MIYLSKINLILVALTILFCQADLHSQDIIPYGLYSNNWKVLNPGAAGLRESQGFDISYRANDTKIDGNPSYVLLSYETLFGKQNSGLGIIFENQQIAFRTRVFGKAIYNYQIPLRDEKKLSMGVGIGFLSETLDFTSIRFVDPRDPISTGNLPASNAFDLDLGVAFKSKKFQGGISLRNLLESRIGKSELFLFDNHTIQHVTAYGEYVFEFRKFQFIQSAFVYTDYKDIFLDLNPTFEILEFLLIGGSFRVSNDGSFVNVNAGIHWKNKIQIMGILYSSGYRGIGNDFEFNLGIRIDKE